MPLIATMEERFLEHKSISDYRMQWLIEQIARNLDVEKSVVISMLNRHNGWLRKHLIDIFEKGTATSNRPLDGKVLYIYKTFYPKTFYKEVTIMKQVPKPVTLPQSVSPEDDMPLLQKKKTRKRKKKKKKGEVLESKSVEDSIIEKAQEVKEQDSDSSISLHQFDSADEMDDDKNDAETDLQDSDSPKKKRDRKKKKKKRVKSPQSVISALAETSTQPEQEMMTVTLKRIIKKEKMVPQLHARVGDVYLDFTGDPTYFYFLFTTCTGIPIMDSWEESKAEMPSYFIIGQVEKSLFGSFQDTMNLLEDHFAQSFNDAFDTVQSTPCSSNTQNNKKLCLPPLDTIKSTGGFARQMIKILTQIKNENDYVDNVTVDDLKSLESLEDSTNISVKTLVYNSQDIIRGCLSDYPEAVRVVFKRIRSIKEIKEDPDFLIKETCHTSHPVYSLFLERLKTFRSFVVWCYQNHQNKMMITFPELPELENAGAELISDISQDKDFILALEDIVKEWAQYIFKLLDFVRNMMPGGNGPIPLFQYWSIRVTAFSPMYEDLFKPAIDKIIKILSMAESPRLDELISARNAIKAYYNVSLENTDYLNTAFTEIKQLLKSEKIKEMAELLPPIFEHLRVLWTLSPHWGAEDYFSLLLDRVKWVVCTKIKRILDVQDLFTLDLDVVRKICMNSAEFMDFWKKNYLDTRAKIEETECEPRWEFDRDKLFLETDYIATVARSLQEMVMVMQENLLIFCPNFTHAVIESTPIKLIIKKIWNLTVPIMTADFDIFDYEYSENWNIVVQGFWQGIHDLEEDAINVIQQSFKQLRSSDHAVRLLSQFQCVETRGKISKVLTTKLDDVLSKFKDEIHEITDFFLLGQDEPPILRVHQFFSGTITWTRQYFLQLNDNFETIDELVGGIHSEKKEQTYQEFQRLIDKLRDYEYITFHHWLERDLLYLKTAFTRNVIKLIELGVPILDVTAFLNNLDTASERSASDLQMVEDRLDRKSLKRAKKKYKRTKKKWKKRYAYGDYNPQFSNKMKKRQMKMLKLTGKERYRYLKKSYIKKLASFSKQLNKLSKKRQKAIELKEKKKKLRKKVVYKRRQFRKVPSKDLKSMISEYTELDDEFKRLHSGEALKEFYKLHKGKKIKKITEKEIRNRIRRDKQKLKERLKRARKILRKLKSKIEKLHFEKPDINSKRHIKNVSNIQKKICTIPEKLPKKCRRARRWQKRQEKKFKRKKEKLETHKLQIEGEIKKIEARQQQLTDEANKLKLKKDNEREFSDQVRDTVLEETESTISDSQKYIKEIKIFERKLVQKKQQQLAKIDAELKQVVDSTKKLKDKDIHLTHIKFPQIYLGCRHDVYRFSWREFIGMDLLFEHGYSIKLNFDPNFQRIVREAETIHELGFAVPKEIWCLTSLKKLLYIELFAIESVVTLYGDLIKSLSESERAALKNFLVQIENSLNMGLTEHTWSSISVINYSKTIISKLESLNIVISQVKEVERKFLVIFQVVQKIDFFSLHKNTSVKPFSDICSEIETMMKNAELLLAIQYNKMAPALYKLQSIAELGCTGSSEQLSLHYKWAENIFFEALTKYEIRS